MIKRRTVFVLGAGAHEAYGLPSGAKLMRQVAEHLKNARTNSSTGSDLMHLTGLGRTKGHSGISYGYCREMGEAIDGARQASIDAFLEHNSHRDNYDVLGKAAIAQVLLRREHEIGSGGATDDDWLSYLFRQMVRGCGGSGYAGAKNFVEGNKISFVTFNYDCFLERWLHAAIKASFGISREETQQLMSSVDICHVFGSLGTYPAALDPELGAGPWVEAIDRLRLIHEAKEDHTDVTRAARALRSAKVICILGFGFHEENVRLIQLDKAVQDCGLAVASALDFTDVEWARVTKQLFDRSKIRRGKMDWKCTKVLRNFEVV